MFKMMHELAPDIYLRVSYISEVEGGLLVRGKLYTYLSPGPWEKVHFVIPDDKRKFWRTE